MASSSCSIDLSGPTYCIVSGASQGIGRAIAAEVAKLLGPKSLMLLLARKADELAKTASMCQSDNVKAIYKSIDLGKATTKEMNDVIVNSLEGYKVNDFATCLIFHNVGSLGNLAIETSRIEDSNELAEYYDLNVFKVISLNTQFLKIFESVEDRIIIVNVTSLCAIKPMSGMAYYCSGKAAREMYFKVLAEEKKHIKVLNYSPGPVETSMIDYVLTEAVNDNLRDVFTSFKNQGVLLKPDMTARKCMKVLQAGKFTPGEHVDYFDDE
ncbi:PREDICTED: sepiapterin reductase isoform X1 [Papilio polytes]|uniref:sepiapterin reductase isoform X1 n=1 Tax=Papilio polytes TaxID=76194 RepID=UPI000676AE80|nr:PREDICTED: sepiapterin reductase isoform X1 [Papilio polytes]XP_013148317.1 PREDICTED: sepiapterin reductase isoform X1 [Papilio polytes]